MPDVLVVPDVRSLLRRTLPCLVQGKVIPLGLFITAMRLSGLVMALVVGFAWSAGLVAHQRSQGKRIPGLVQLGLVGLAARTIATAISGSTVVYFVQPTISTTLTGLVFLGSVLLGRPLAARLALDFVPFDARTAAHPELARFFRRLSLLWGASSLLNAMATLWLLSTQTLTTVVVVRTCMGPALTLAVITTATVWFRSSLRRQGMRLVFARPEQPADPVVAPVLATLAPAPALSLAA